MIKNFEQFGESLNEGLISWMKRKFNPKDMDDVIIDIIEYIKSNFDIDKLKVVKRNDKVLDGIIFYKVSPVFEYHTDKDDIIYISDFMIKLNQHDITNYVDIHYIDKLYNFFKEKFDNRKKEKENKKLSSLKSELKYRYRQEEE